MRDLPKRMHLKHGGYYYVHRNKWTFLARDYGDALRIYAGIIAPKRGGFVALLDRYMAGLTLAPKTLKTYTVVANRLRTAFQEFEPSDIQPHHLYRYLSVKGVSRPMSAHYRSVMVGAMQLAVKEGLVAQNLMREVENFSSGKRDRYLTDAEFRAIRDKATPTLRSIMDLCYCTAQRIGDILAIRHSDLTEDGIAFKQQKTDTRLCVAWSPELEQAVKDAKALHQSLKGMTLLHTRQGTPFKYSTVRTLWDRACKAAKVENAHLHDIRAKAATDAKKQGIDSKALLGHKSDAVHQRYLRGKDVPIVQGLRRVS